MYRVKVSLYERPVMVFAESIHHARALAELQHAVCECGCGRRGRVEWVGKISPQLAGL